MTPEQAAQRIAEAINKVDLWQSFTEGERQAWIKAVEPVIAEAVAHGYAMARVTQDGGIDLIKDFLNVDLGGKS